MVSSGVADDIRAEAGNIRYEYFFPMEDAETVLLIDSWEDQHSIDAHHASPMMAKIIGLREKYGLHMKVERYVSDEDGVPEADKAFPCISILAAVINVHCNRHCVSLRKSIVWS